MHIIVNGFLLFKILQLANCYGHNLERITISVDPKYKYVLAPLRLHCVPVVLHFVSTTGYRTDFGAKPRNIYDLKLYLFPLFV